MVGIGARVNPQESIEPEAIGAHGKKHMFDSCRVFVPIIKVYQDLVLPESSTIAPGSILARAWNPFQFS